MSDLHKLAAQVPEIAGGSLESFNVRGFTYIPGPIIDLKVGDRIKLDLYGFVDECEVVAVEVNPDGTEVYRMMVCPSRPFEAD